MTGAGRHAQHHPAKEPSRPSRPSIAFPEVSQKSAASPRFHRAARVRRRVCRGERRMRAAIIIHARKSQLRPRRRRRLKSFASRQGTPDPGDRPCHCPRGLAESKALRGFASAQDPEWGVVTSYGCLIQFQAMNRPPNRRADQAFSTHGTDEARRRPRALKAAFAGFKNSRGRHAVPSRSSPGADCDRMAVARGNICTGRRIQRQQRQRPQPQKQPVPDLSPCCDVQQGLNIQGLHPAPGDLDTPKGRANAQRGATRNTLVVGSPRRPAPFPICLISSPGSPSRCGALPKRSSCAQKPSCAAVNVDQPPHDAPSTYLTIALAASQEAKGLALFLLALKPP